MSQDSSPMYCCEAVTFVRIQPWFFAELFVSINPSQHLSFLKVISYGFTILTILPQWTHHLNQTLLRCFYDVQCAIWTSFILDSWTAGLANLLAEKKVSDWKCFWMLTESSNNFFSGIRAGSWRSPEVAMATDLLLGWCKSSQGIHQRLCRQY